MSVFVEYFLDYFINFILRQDTNKITYPQTVVSLSALTADDPDTKSRLVVLPELLDFHNTYDQSTMTIGPGGSIAQGFSDDRFTGQTYHLLLSSDHASPKDKNDTFISANLFANSMRADAANNLAVFQSSHEMDFVRTGTLVERRIDDIVVGFQYDISQQLSIPTISAGMQYAGENRTVIPVYFQSPIRVNTPENFFNMCEIVPDGIFISKGYSTVQLTVMDSNLALNVPTVENPVPSYTVQKMLPININGNVYHVQLLAPPVG